MAHLQHLKKNEILVSRKNAVVVYLERVNKLMIEAKGKQESELELFLQGTGAACQNTIEVANLVEETFPGIVAIEDVQTFSVPLIYKKQEKGLLTEITVESDLAFMKTEEEEKDNYRM